MPEQLLNTNQVADELGVSPITLANWRRVTRKTGEQHGPQFIHPSGTAMIRYRRGAVDAWLDTRKEQTPEQRLFALNQQSTTLTRVRNESGDATLTQNDVDALREEVRRG